MVIGIQNFQFVICNLKISYLCKVLRMHRVSLSRLNITGAELSFSTFVKIVQA